MIIGIGSDIIDIRRVAKVIERHGDRFLDRIFTDAEKAKAARRAANEKMVVATYAKRFAAKEACSKALGTGIRRGVWWRDMGVINLPVVKFSVDWWNTLHQGSSTFFADKGDHLPAIYAWPAAFMALAYLGGFGALWLVRIRALVWRRKARSLSMKLAEGAR